MTNQGDNIQSIVDEGIDVTIQDPTSPLFQYFLTRELKTDITLTTDIAVDDEVINVSSGHGFTGISSTPGEVIVVWYNNAMLQMDVVSVSTDAITVSHPVARVMLKDILPATYDTPEIAAAVVVRGNKLMNIDAENEDVDFSLNLRNFQIPIDISAFVVTMQHGANVPDDGTFGGIAALTQGMYIRKEDGVAFNLGNYRTNQDFKDVGGLVNYTAKAPGGTNATDISFDIKKVFGQVIRLNPRTNDLIRAVQRDDVSTLEGMTKMVVSVIGSYTSGE